MPRRLIVQKTIRDEQECKIMARYLLNKYRGKIGGTGLLEAAMTSGDCSFLQDWIDDYGLTEGGRSIWVSAQAWLRNQRKAPQSTTTIQLKMDTKALLDAEQEKFPRKSYNDIILDLFKSREENNR